MIDKEIDFYRFSGTGNTLLAVKAMAEVFRQHGHNVNLLRIEKCNPRDLIIRRGLTIGLGFTVAAGSTYRFVWEFLKSLPEADGNKVFMIDTMAGFSGGIIGPLQKLLKSKGYTPIGAKEIIMPNNLLPYKDYGDKNSLKIERGLKRAENYARNLLDGKTRWGRIPVFSFLMSLVGKSRFVWRYVARFYGFYIDNSLCNKCGLCARLCPVGNITMKDYPEYGDKCEVCMRCFSFCPTLAVNSRKKGRHRYAAVKTGDLIKK